MVEVFKTNVRSVKDARFILAEIKHLDAGYVANFDLQDPDRILRVLAHDGFIQVTRIIEIVRRFGFHATVLEDEYVPFNLYKLDSN